MSIYYLVTTFDNTCYPKVLVILTKYFAEAIAKGFNINYYIIVICYK